MAKEKNGKTPAAGRPAGMRDIKFNPKVLAARFSLLAVMFLLAGIATQIIPQGAYQREVVDGHTVVVANSFQFLEGARLPVWRWFTAPFEALVGDQAFTSITIALCILLMGGVMVLLEESKVLVYLVSGIIKKFGGDPFKMMYLIVLVLMLMGSTISFYDQAAIFLPMTMGICFAVGWDSLMGIALSCTAVGMGFSVSTINPSTIGIPQTIVGLPVGSGVGLRAVLFVVTYLVYVSFLRSYGKKLLKDPSASLTRETDANIRHLFPSQVDEEVLADKKVRNGAFALAGALLVVVIYTLLGTQIKGLSSLSMLVMLISLTVGSSLSAKLSGRVKKKGVLKDFVQGFRLTLPSVLIILVIMGIRQIIVNGNILDTILYYAYQGIAGMNPYQAVFVIWGITLAFEFVVGSASAKAFLILPLLLPLGNMVGLTNQTIVQAYLFGDGFTNCFYPTSTMLLLTTGLMGIPLSKWYKWTWKLMLAVVAIVVVTLLICVRIGYGPF